MWCELGYSSWSPSVSRPDRAQDHYFFADRLAPRLAVVFLAVFFVELLLAALLFAVRRLLAAVLFAAAALVVVLRLAFKSPSMKVPTFLS